MPDKRPNVLVIMSDQHHAGVMGCAGDAVAQTPNLDRLAAAGALFRNAYCPFPLCAPSRMAFMTAQHPFQIDCWTNETQLDSDAATFAHALLAAGYETVLAGRMHFVRHDQRHGFVRRLIGDVQESAHLAAGWKLDRVLGDLRDTCGCGQNSIIKSGPGRTGYQAYDKAVTDSAVAYLRGRRGGAGPFLLVVGFVLPHCPFVAPPEDFEAFADRIAVEDLPQRDDAMHPAMQNWRRQSGVEQPPPIDAQWRTRAAYYGMCRLMDRNVGRILEALRDAGLLDDTIVVYTSDHGEMLGEHGLWWKSTFYDGACRVPLIVSRPDRATDGATVRENVSLIDVGPTLLDLAGAAPMPAVSGSSFHSLMDGDGSWPDTAFAENLCGLGGRAAACRMVRKGQWKYNYYHGADGELFNLVEDPGERDNLWSDPACR